MKLIPVIDLMNGQTVTAKRGERHSYAPSNTPLCRSSNPGDVLSALLELHPFDTVYIADLDAIDGKGSNLPLIETLSHDHDGIDFWIDNGLSELDRLCGFARPVIGSESLASCEELSRLTASLPAAILSLDYFADRFRGPGGLDGDAARWPADVIVMTLSRVGAASGPDLPLLQQLSKLRPGLRLYAAGGARGPQDLQRLRAFGAAGVLLSTALHQGAIGTADIQHFLGP